MRLAALVTMFVVVCLAPASALRLTQPKMVPCSNWSSIDGAGPLQLNGTASLGGGAIKLTSSAYTQVGSAFRKAPVDVTAWETSFSFRLQGPGENADGITLCIHNDPKGALALGSAGGFLGYGVCETWDTPGITNSIAIEFDDYFNEGFNDLPGDHVGIDTDGSIVSKVAVPSPFPLDSDTINVTVTYYSEILTVYMSAGDPKSRNLAWPRLREPILSYQVDIPAIVGSDTAYIGFTGATATFFQASEIVSWTFANPMRWEGPPRAGDATLWDDRQAL